MKFFAAATTLVLLQCASKASAQQIPTQQTPAVNISGTNPPTTPLNPTTTVNPPPTTVNPPATTVNPDQLPSQNPQLNTSAVNVSAIAAPTVNPTTVNPTTVNPTTVNPTTLNDSSLASQPQTAPTKPYEPGQAGGNGTNNTIPEPQYISMNCTQAFMPLQADTADNTTTSDATTAPGVNSSAPVINITEAGCKTFETPDGAYCRAESCSGLPTCQNCNLLIPGATANDTTISNVTTQSVACAGNYFMPDLNETVRQSLCTDAQAQSYSCTGPCISYATCEVCISMDDPALQDTSNATNSSSTPTPSTTSTPPSRKWK